MQSTLKIFSIFICLILAFSPLAFASDLSLPDQSPDPEQEPLEVESVPDPWLSLESKTMELRATEKTITDVYNILHSGLMSGNNPKLDNIYSIISDCLEFYTDDPLHRYTIADLVGMTWGLVNSINNQLTSTNSILGNIYNETYTTNRKLEYVFSAIEDTINIKWYSLGDRYSGTSLGFNNSFLSAQTYSNNFKVAYSFTSDFIHPYLYRFSLPVSRNSFSYSTISDYRLISIKATTNFTNFSNVPFGDYYIELTDKGTFLYLFDFKPFPTYTYFFEIANGSQMTFMTNGQTGVFYIPFDTLDYQIIKTAFNQAKSADSDKQSLDQLVQISAQLSTLAQSSQSGSEAAEALADYIVSPEKQAAEDASSQVINSTLNNFTGSGSGAAKSSDSNAMKDVSGSLQSGLNAGGSVSGAIGVFNSGSDFWGWFTQENSNYINNPYPAPVVNNTRKSSGSGDEIVDFLTPNSNQLQDLLRQGGDQR